jgi:hypothetical protein
MVPEAMHSSAARLINTRGRVAAHAQRQSRTRKRERERRAVSCFSLSAAEG